MPDHVLPLPSRPAVPVRGGGLFPVRRIFCVGRNYAAHAREMGGNPDREPPFFFGKPADALLTGGDAMRYPTATANLHYEVELVVAIGSPGRAIPVADAMAHVWGYAVGLDMTRRDLQDVAKKAGRPWDMAKGFDQSAPIGDLVPVGAAPTLDRARITLSVNGAVRQDATLDAMIWSVPETIAALSDLVELAPGDLVFTGTPEGVGAVAVGDIMVATITGLPELRTPVVS